MSGCVQTAADNCGISAESCLAPALLPLSRDVKHPLVAGTSDVETHTHHARHRHDEDSAGTTSVADVPDVPHRRPRIRAEFLIRGQNARSVGSIRLRAMRSRLRIPAADWSAATRPGRDPFVRTFPASCSESQPRVVAGKLQPVALLCSVRVRVGDGPTPAPRWRQNCISLPSVGTDQTRPCPHCGELAGIEFDVAVGRYRCMRPGCRYKAALQRCNERRRIDNGPPVGVPERRSGHDRRCIGDRGEKPHADGGKLL